MPAQDVVYRLLFVCGDTHEVLTHRFTGGGGAIASRTKGHTAKSQKYWNKYLPFVDMAVRIRGEESFREMKKPATAVARELVKRLSPAQYKTLTWTEVPTDRETRWVERQFATLLRLAFADQQDAQVDDTLRPIDVVDMRILSHRMRPVAGYVGTSTKPPADGLGNLS